jgi:hypothetical protein
MLFGALFDGEGSLAYMLPTSIQTVSCFSPNIVMTAPIQETGIHVGFTFKDWD